MPEKFDLAQMLAEIAEDEGEDTSQKGQLSQDAIKKLLAAKKKSKAQKATDGPQS